MAESQQMEQSLQVVMEHEVVQAQLSEMLDGCLLYTSPSPRDS